MNLSKDEDPKATTIKTLEYEINLLDLKKQNIDANKRKLMILLHKLE